MDDQFTTAFISLLITTGIITAFLLWMLLILVFLYKALKVQRKIIKELKDLKKMESKHV